MKFGSPLSQPVKQFQLGQIDFLGNFNIASAFSSTGFLTALNPYTALAIVVADATGVVPLCVSMYNNTVGSAGFQPRFVAAFDNKGTLFPSSNFYSSVPCANNTGDSLEITVFFSAATGAGGTVYVYGLTASPPPLTRPDGRVYPIGCKTARAGSAGGGLVTLIPAPTAPLRILILSAMAWAPAADFVDVLGTVNGGVSEPIAVGSGGGQLTEQWEAGLLMDVATQVQWDPSAAACGVNIAYDLVA